MEDIKFALLIDSDNISADYVRSYWMNYPSTEPLLTKESMGNWTPFQFKQMEGCAVSQFHQPGTAIQLYDR